MHIFFKSHDIFEMNNQKDKDQKKRKWQSTLNAFFAAKEGNETIVAKNIAKK